MKDLADDLRTVDPQIAWRRDEMTLFDTSVFREDNFSALELKVDGKKKFIQIDWAKTLGFVPYRRSRIKWTVVIGSFVTAIR